MVIVMLQTIVFVEVILQEQFVNMQFASILFKPIQQFALEKALVFQTILVIVRLVGLVPHVMYRFVILFQQQALRLYVAVMVLAPLSITVLVQLVGQDKIVNIQAVLVLIH